MQYNMSNDVMPWPTAPRRVGGPQDSGGDYGPDSGYIGQNLNPLQQFLVGAGGRNNMRGGGAGGLQGLQALIQRIMGGQGQQQGQSQDFAERFAGMHQTQAPADLPERFAQQNRPPADLVERFAQAQPQGQATDPSFYRNQARPAAIMGSHLMANQLAQFIQKARNPALPASAASWIRGAGR